MKRLFAGFLTILLCMSVFCVPARAESVPYTVELDAEEKIYKGHGEDSGYSRQIGKDGVYTIVREAYDECGNLWGKLKSGLGWVMLQEKPEPVFRETPYTTRLEGIDDILSGPGYDCEYVRTVGKDGVYTIVEEAIGSDGFLWGRLKSGLGWVRLSDMPVQAPAVSDDSAYTVSLDAWVPVYDFPGEEEGDCIGIIGEDGVYTIVSEVLDGVGNVWGRLKSGAGWVNLNYVRTMGHPPVTAYFAEVIDLAGSEWIEHITEESEFMVRIAFRANEHLKDVELTTLTCGEMYEVGDVHCLLSGLEEDTYFVAGVVFYGDMTTYGISFEDERGEMRYYAVSLSGMDGSLVMNEYVQ